MTTQSERLDQFLDALSRDPNAVAPADLDSDLAQFARTLIKSQTTISAPNVKMRVWQKALAAASQQPNEQKEPYSMNALPALQPPMRKAARMFSYLTALAATVILVFIWGTSFNSLNGQHLSGVSLAISTETPSLVPFSTSTPSLVIPITTVMPAPGSMWVFPTLRPTSLLYVFPEQSQPPIITIMPPPTFIPTPLSTPILIGHQITGKLTSESPQLRYRIKADEAGLLKVTAYSEAFKVRLTYSIESSPQVYPGTLSNETDVAARKEIIMLAHVLADEEITLTVGSELGNGTGDFSLVTSFGKVTPLEMGKPVDRWIVPGADNTPELQYFAFDAQAGFLIDVRVESDENQDLTLFMQSNFPSPQNPYGAIRFIADMTPGCTDIYILQCYDDDSGPGSDPELRHVLIRQDGHYELIVSSIVVANLASHYKISLSSSITNALTPGSRVFTTLSWKDPAVPFLFQGYAGKSIQFKFERLAGDQSFIRLTAVQNNQTLSSYTLTASDSTTTQTVTPTMDGAVALFVEYAQPVNQDAVTVFSLGQIASP